MRRSHSSIHAAWKECPPAACIRIQPDEALSVLRIECIACRVPWQSLIAARHGRVSCRVCNACRVKGLRIYLNSCEA